MKFLPLTRQVQLSGINPENIVSAAPSTFLYRVGNDSFFFVDKNQNLKRADISKKAMALKYRSEPWFATIKEEEIVYETSHEIWQKTSGHGKTGWKFITYKSFDFVQLTPIPTPTPTPTPTPAPTF